jgi:putative ABC transport system permease protein
VATRYFGTTNPIGREMTITYRNEKNNVIVTGVYRDLPTNTHIKADILLPSTILGVTTISNLRSTKGVTTQHFYYYAPMLTTGHLMRKLSNR